MDLDARTAELFEHFSTQEFDGLLTMIQGLKRDGVTVEYSDIRRSMGERFVVEQHLVRLTRPDGVSASTDVCVMLHFDEQGLITGLHEYVDTAALSPLLS